MSITIIRHTGWLGEGSALAIKLNGKKVAKISPGKQLSISLPEEPATVQVSRYGGGSNPLPVTDGEIIEITSWKGTNKLFFFSLLIFPILTMLVDIYIPIFRIRMTIRAIFAFVYLFIMFQINWYQLKKI